MTKVKRMVAARCNECGAPVSIVEDGVGSVHGATFPWSSCGGVFEAVVHADVEDPASFEEENSWDRTDLATFKGKRTW